MTQSASRVRLSRYARPLSLVSLVSLLSLPLVLALGCRGSKGRDAPSRRNFLRVPGPSERLHPPGELRLTSAGSAPRLALRYRFPADQRLAYRTSTRFSYSGPGGVGHMKVTFDWERRVTSATPTEAKVQVLVRRVRTVRPSSARDRVIHRLLGMTWRATLGPRGRVRALVPADVLGAEPTRQAIRWLSTPLPADPVGDGATWERSETWRVHLPRGGAAPLLRVQVRYALALVRKRGEARQARVRGSLALRVASDRASAPAPRIHASGQGSALLVLDLTRGVVVRAESDARYSVGAGPAGAAPTSGSASPAPGAFGAVVTFRGRTRAIRVPKRWRTAPAPAPPRPRPRR